MDEDDDAFLYGESAPAQPAHAPDVSAQAVIESGAKALADGAQTVGAAGGENGEDDDDEDEEDEEEEEEDSDSDLEIIVDGSTADARPPPGYNQRPLQPYNKSLQLQKAPASAITSEYTPRARPGQAGTAADSLASAAGLPDDASATGRPGYPAPHLIDPSTTTASQAELPEGPPPHAPSTAPRIDLDPADHNLLLPPETVDGEPGPLIYHVDPTNMEEKAWRRPGADLTDWFNYGFDEDSWRAWAVKKTDRSMERHEIQRKGEAEGYDTSHAQQQHDGQSHYDNNPMSQQMQLMQGMTGMNMPPDQLMAFLGMAPGGMQGMMGMGGFGNGMFGMPQQQVMPMHMMQQQQQQDQYPQQQQQQEDHQQYSAMQEQGNTSNFPARSGLNGLPERPQFDSPMPEEQLGIKRELIEGAATPQTGDAVGPNGGSSSQQAEDGNRTPTGPSAERVRGQAGAPQAPSRAAGVAGAPTGPRGGPPPRGPAADRKAGNVSGNAPTGPRNPGRRYNDRDNGMGAADALDYGGGGSARDRERSMSRGPMSPAHRRNESYNGSRATSVENSPRGLRRIEEEDREYERERDRRYGSRSHHDYDEERRSHSRRNSDDGESIASTTTGDRRSSRRGGGAPSGRSDRDRERSERRRGGRHDDSPEDTQQSEAQSSRRGGRGARSGGETSSSSRSQARAKRRAGGNDDDRSREDDAVGAATSSRGGRTRKRGATEDSDGATTPPRETRRRR